MTRLKGFLPSMHTLAALALFALVCTATAVAANKISGSTIKKGTITKKQIAKNTISENRLNAGVRAKLNKAGGTGATGPPGQSGTATYTNPEWAIIDRNTIGSAVGALRAGPYTLPANTGTPPFGVGSLGLQTSNAGTTSADPAEKVSFGNQVDFAGQPVLGLTQVGFRAFQTGENNGTQANPTPTNVPNITFEIDPNLTADPTNFSSMVWNPATPLASNQWSGYLDATTTGDWFLTGNAGTATNCTLNNRCTFAQLKAALDDGGASGAPQILTAAVVKGRDFTYSGAVDGLRINNVVYDFEPFGVVERAP